jgi:hypothetical protein
MKTTNPQDIFDNHLRKAIAPYAEQLRVEAELDRKLASKAESIHPSIFEEKLGQLLERATAGDAEAEATLDAAGGADNYVKTHAAGYDLAEGKRRYAANACAPLWKKVAADAIPAIDRAESEIQQQLEAVLEELGELPPSVTQWGARCRSLRHIFDNAARQAAAPMWIGAGFLVRQMGLDDLIRE